LILTKQSHTFVTLKYASESIVTEGLHSEDIILL